MPGVWEKEVRRLLERQQIRLASVVRQMERSRNKASEALQGLEQDKQALKKELDRFKAESATLMTRRDDPEVVVRDYNKTTLYTYHADTDCGWSPMRWEYILLSEAKDLGYHPCSSCGYRVGGEPAD